MFEENAIRDHILACVRCGKCLARCPIYRQTHDEKYVARGKISLTQAFLEGDEDLAAPLWKAAQNCLYCLNCQDTCPNSLPMDLIIPYVRNITSYHSKMVTALRKFVSSTAEKPENIRKLAKRVKRVLDILSQTGSKESGFFLRLAVPNFPRERLLPRLAATSFLESVPEKINKIKSEKRIGFFVGCLHNFLDAPTGFSVLKLLKALKVNIFIPKNQTCCGLPFFAMGMEEAYSHLARTNIQAFAKDHVDTIVSACPTCVFTIKHHYHHLGPQGKTMANKIIDLPTFLWQNKDKIRLVLLPEKRTEFVTYHDPCHLAGVLKVRQQPRDLLTLLYGDHFIEMEEADRCCGGGGSFSCTHYDLSKNIGYQKVHHVQAWKDKVLNDFQDESGADMIDSSGAKLKVVTTCPLCEIQLRDLIRQADLNVDVTQLVDEIANNLRPENIASHVD